jgi:multiple sugar transport system substrate-binding protein
MIEHTTAAARSGVAGEALGRPRHVRPGRGLSRRRFALTGSLLAGGGAAAVSACGGESRPQTPETAVPAKLVYVSPAASGGRLDLEAGVLKDFNATRPNGDIAVEVAAGPGGWDTLREKFIVSAAGGQPIHIVQNGWGGWMDLADGGSIAELSASFKRDKVDQGLFMAEAIGEYSDGSKVWALPTSLSVDAIAYNLDLFDAAGLKYPPTDPQDRTWTMDRFLEVARLLTRLPDQAGFGGAISGDNSGGMTEGTYFGQGPWDDARKQTRFTTDGMRTGLQYWLDLLARHHVQPTADETAAMRGKPPCGATSAATCSSPARWGCRSSTPRRTGCPSAGAWLPCPTPGRRGARTSPGGPSPTPCTWGRSRRRTPSGRC